MSFLGKRRGRLARLLHESPPTHHWTRNDSGLRIPLHGVPVWLVCAGILYASRHRDARRAALRGLVSMATSWGLLAIPRYLRPDGTFPSRRSAISTAFVTGAALELPWAGPPLGALAAALTVANTSEEGLAGAGTGAAVAFATTQLWPVPPRLGPGAPKVWLPAHAEPSPDGEGLFIAVNAASGGGEDDAPTEGLKRALPKAEVVEIEVKDGSELRRALDEAADRSVALGISGGDGSINTAAQVALDHEKALAIFPSGTLNHFAAALGIDSISEAVDAIKSGEAVGIDVATIDGRVFLNTASFGSYVKLVDARERLERKIGKWPAVVVALVGVFRNDEPVCVEIEGRQTTVWMAFIGNCRYHPSGFAPSWRERMDDELLDFRYIDATEPFARPRLVLAVLTGRLGRSKVYKQVLVDRLDIKSLQGPIRLARDGETFDGSEEIVVEKLDKRLAVYASHAKKTP